MTLLYKTISKDILRLLEKDDYLGWDVFDGLNSTVFKNNTQATTWKAYMKRPNFQSKIPKEHQKDFTEFTEKIKVCKNGRVELLDYKSFIYREI